MKDTFFDRLFAPLRQSGHYRLASILELSQMKGEQLKKLAQREQGALYSLMQQKALSHLQQIGTALYAPSANATLQGQSDFYWQTTDLARDAICGWIVSSLPAAPLAIHLAQANSVLSPDGQRYLLRYHTEQSLRVLHARQDLPDVCEWLAPIHSWWVTYPDASRKAWCCVPGSDRPATRELTGLALDEGCWEALASEPLAYRLAEQLKGSLQAFGKPQECHSVRVGMAFKHLSLARESGFAEHHDLITYATCTALMGESLSLDPAWQAAVKEALTQHTPLAISLPSHLRSLPD